MAFGLVETPLWPRVHLDEKLCKGVARDEPHEGSRLTGQGARSDNV